MPQAMDRAGNFRGPVLSMALRKSDNSSSRFIELKMRADEMWDEQEKQWIPWAQYEQEAYGGICIIKKDGTVNKIQVETLLRNGWSGDFASIVDGSVEFQPMRFSVKKDEFTKKDGSAGTGFKLDWIDEFDSTPGGKALESNVDASEAKALSAMHGGALRALAGNLKRNGTAPSGRPAAPPPASAMNTPAAAAVAAGDIPF